MGVFRIGKRAITTHTFVIILGVIILVALIGFFMYVILTGKSSIIQINTTIQGILSNASNQLKNLQ